MLRRTRRTPTVTAAEARASDVPGHVQALRPGPKFPDHRVPDIGSWNLGRGHEYEDNRRAINAVLADLGLAPIEDGPLALGVRDALGRHRGRQQESAATAFADSIMDVLRAHDDTAVVPESPTPQHLAQEVSRVITRVRDAQASTSGAERRRRAADLEARYELKAESLRQMTTAITETTGIHPMDGESPSQYARRAILLALKAARADGQASGEEATAGELAEAHTHLSAALKERDDLATERAEIREALEAAGFVAGDPLPLAVGHALRDLRGRADQARASDVNAGRRALQRIAGAPTRMVVTTTGQGRARSVLVEREDGSREALPFPVAAVRLELGNGPAAAAVTFRCDVTVEPEADDERAEGPWTIAVPRPDGLHHGQALGYRPTAPPAAADPFGGQA